MLIPFVHYVAVSKTSHKWPNDFSIIIILSGRNNTWPEYYMESWLAAIKDKSVINERRNNYRI